ncbi:hypothetical protein [Pseudooceanicola sp.]|uniref:hypothetical protein n=1 Tax=Pseudooceanicola sp. TaxID=1914328 RepID=UPI0026153BCA|nr:hypothetical protein [Pseudooceanicola sp.]MDF1854500.1 hypothetical protein [Pseudooceanicola sp.]
MKRLSMTFAATMLISGPAAADCAYMGGYYPVGSVICAAGGWLEQCTVADYWSAIGQCNASDDPTGGIKKDGTETFSTDTEVKREDSGTATSTATD